MAHNDSFDEPRFEALYRKLYPDLLRCAEIALRTGGSWYVSVAGRAEEVVQELFAFAWEHQADLWSSASPTGWLYRVLRYKVLERGPLLAEAPDPGRRRDARFSGG